jgi:hypothetical protein
VISVEKPGSPEEVLEHHGVKGMKWGVRKARGATSHPNLRRAGRAADAGLAGTVAGASLHGVLDPLTAASVGAAVTVHVLRNHGSLPHKHVKK